MNSLEQQKQKADKKMIYLASPHSNPHQHIRQARYQEALECTSFLIENGFWVYSPIVSCHNLPCNNEANTNWEFWKEFDTELISNRMDEVWVLEIMEATKYSKGVRAEVELAKKLGKRIVSIWKQPHICSNPNHFHELNSKQYNCYDVTDKEVDYILGC